MHNTWLRLLAPAGSVYPLIVVIVWCRINLGTNDAGSATTPEYEAVYTQLVLDTFAAYGPSLQVFLACGPMSENYCNPVHNVIANLNRLHSGQVSFLDQRGFLDGSHGPSCCGHPR
jgi:hypothetical protein